MSNRRSRLQLVLEPFAAVVSLLAYAIMKLYISPSSFGAYGIALQFLLVVAIGIIVIFAVSGIIEVYGRYSRSLEEAHETERLIKLIAYPLLIVLLLQTLTVPIASLLVGAGFLGIIVGLAAQSTLGNVFAGISFWYSRPFKVGDKITLSPMSSSSSSVQAPSYPHDPMITDITGTVKSIGLIYTRLIKPDRALMFIPNSLLNQGFIQNHSRIDDKLLKVRLEVKRSTDTDLFKKRLTEKLSGNLIEFEKLRDFQIRLSLISTNDSLGIVITANVMILDHDRLSQWVTETAIKTLLEIENKEKERKRK